MDLLQTSTFEIKYSKTNHPVPVVDGVHLHSIYNPIKEAEAFVAKHEKTFQEKNLILFLGLGFGYHIDQAIFQLRKFHGDHYHVSIIEKNQKTVENYFRFSNQKDARITVYHAETASALYENKDLVHFMLQSPGVIPHPASFNLYQSFFKSFMGYKSPKTAKDITRMLQTQELKDYFAKFPESHDILTIAKNDLAQKELTELDFFMLAFHEMATYKKTKRQEEHSV